MNASIPTPSELETFRALLIQSAGLRFDEGKRPYLTELLAKRVEDNGAHTVENYFRRFASTTEELQALAQLLTVSETYFFRDRGQINAFQAWLRERENTGPHNLTLLSAGCSTGDEAYTLAIMVRETLQRSDTWKITIRGLDLNPAVIEKARTAKYTAWSLRETPQHIQNKYFKNTGRHFILDPSIRDMVRFEQCNLVSSELCHWGPESLDLVFCRNVLMYFSPRVAKKVIAQFTRCLKIDGLLFLGHAENLRGLSNGYHLKHSHGTFYYQRRDTRTDADDKFVRAHDDASKTVREPTHPPSEGALWYRAIAKASNRIEQLSLGTDALQSNHSVEARRPDVLAKPKQDPGLVSAMNLMKEERFLEALAMLPPATTQTTAEPDELLLRAALLVSTDELGQAEEICTDILTIDELNAGAHYLLAICHEHHGDRPGAIEHSQVAAYLDPDFAMPHLQLGRIARRSGDLAVAKRELGLALGLLSRENAARIMLFGGGFGRDALIQLCRGEIKACEGSL